MRTLIKMVAACALALAGGAAHAQSFPEPGKTLTMLIPYPPGGPSDVSARILIASLEKQLGTTIQLLHKPGAGTQIASSELVRSKPDGYTILMAPPLALSLSYLDPDRQAAYTRADFAPVAHFAAEANLVIVPGDSPYKSIEELTAAAKENPKKVRMGTVGLMGNTHLAGIALEEATGARFAYVHFNGAAPLATAMLGGNVDTAISGTLSTLPHERAGTMRVLATLGDTGSRFFPGAKSLREMGYDVYSPSLFGFYVRAGTPDAIIDRWAEAVRLAMEDEDFKKKFAEITLEPAYLGPKEFTDLWAQIDTDMARLLAIGKQRQD